MKKQFTRGLVGLVGLVALLGSNGHGANY